MSDPGNHSMQDLSDEKIEQEIEAAMQNAAARSITTWIEPNEDQPTDEDAYRRRLEEQGLELVDHLIEAIETE